MWLDAFWIYGCRGNDFYGWSTELKVYLTDVTPLLDAELFEIMLRKVSPERRLKTEQYHLMKDRILSLGAGLLMQYGFKKFGVETYVLKLNNYGKPYLKPPFENIFFNLSHSGNYVMGIFGDVENGCDIEKVCDVDFELAKYCFSDKELEILIHSGNDAHCFYELWTRKESLSKAMGTGLSSEMRRSLTVDETDEFHAISGQSYYLHSYPLPDGYVGSVCSLKRNFPDVPEMINLVQAFVL